MTVNEKNARALHDLCIQLSERIEALDGRVSRLEGANAALAADIANTKQLVAHVMGRGMPATTE